MVTLPPLSLVSGFAPSEAAVSVSSLFSASAVIVMSSSIRARASVVWIFSARAAAISMPPSAVEALGLFLASLASLSELMPAVLT